MLRCLETLDDDASPSLSPSASSSLCEAISGVNRETVILILNLVFAEIPISLRSLGIDIALSIFGGMGNVGLVGRSVLSSQLIISIVAGVDVFRVLEGVLVMLDVLRLNILSYDSSGLILALNGSRTVSIGYSGGLMVEAGFLVVPGGISVGSSANSGVRSIEVALDENVGVAVGWDERLIRSVAFSLEKSSLSVSSELL